MKYSLHPLLLFEMYLCKKCKCEQVYGITYEHLPSLFMFIPFSLHDATAKNASVNLIGPLGQLESN